MIWTCLLHHSGILNLSKTLQLHLEPAAACSTVLMLCTNSRTNRAKSEATVDAAGLRAGCACMQRCPSDCRCAAAAMRRGSDIVCMSATQLDPFCIDVAGAGAGGSHKSESKCHKGCNNLLTDNDSPSSAARVRGIRQISTFSLYPGIIASLKGTPAMFCGHNCSGATKSVGLNCRCPHFAVVGN